MQAQFTALMTVAKGNPPWWKRYLRIAPLAGRNAPYGLHSEIIRDTARIVGDRLYRAVLSTDLRASAVLILTGLVVRRNSCW